jgi:hypothetical protein
MQNIKFIYLYRDASNYKRWGEVVFANPDGITSGAIGTELERAFMADGLFIAHQIRVPETLIYSDGVPTVDDHCFHEFDSVCLTAVRPTDKLHRTIGEFLKEVTRESHAGWRVFDPCDRLHPEEVRSRDSLGRRGFSAGRRLKQGTTITSR